MEIAQYIQEGKAVLGIEFGSTRIKAVLIGESRRTTCFRQPQLGESLRGWCVDIPRGGYLEWFGRLLSFLGRASTAKIQRNAHKACSNWFFGDDAWIFGVRCERRLLGSIPYLAQYNDRRGGRAVDGTVCV